MAAGESDTPDPAPAPAPAPVPAPTPAPPDWAEGLKRLYDSVVEEPLPDALKELLEKLDGEGA